MTPQERAEKIVKIFMGYEKAQDKSFYDHVLAEIQEAIWKDRDQRTADDLYKLSRQNGFNLGKEMAAKKADQIAEQKAGSSPNFRIIIGTAEIIATNIRALQMPEDK